MSKTSPKISILLVIAALLTSGCASFNPQPRNSNIQSDTQLHVEELTKSNKSWNGVLLPKYPEGQPEVTILRITVPPGIRLEQHFHPVINAGVLLSGELTVVAADGKTLELHAGDPIVELANTMHYGVNEGKEPADIIVWYAGVTGQPITVKE